MNRATEMELMRLLHGELPPGEARALRDRLEREPELAAAWERLERSWRVLELPPPAPIPLGFAQRVAAQAGEQAGALSWAAAPGWVRAAAATALVTGIALGAGVGLWSGDPRRIVQVADEQLSAAVGDTSGAISDDDLAGSYWNALDEMGEAP